MLFLISICSIRNLDILEVIAKTNFSKSKNAQPRKRRNRDLEEAKRKLGREILDVNRNTENEAQKFSQIKHEIDQLKVKENDLLQRQKQDQA